MELKCNFIRTGRKFFTSPRFVAFGINIVPEFKASDHADVRGATSKAFKRSTPSKGLRSKSILHEADILNTQQPTVGGGTGGV